jgi:hypothetical protein
MDLTACYQIHDSTPMFLGETHLKEFKNKHIRNVVADSSLLFLDWKQISQEITYVSREIHPFIREIDPAVVKKSIQSAYLLHKNRKNPSPSKYNLI